MTQNRTSFELIEEIKKSLSVIKLDLPLGFDADTSPNKEWLIDILSSVNPNHEFFQILEKPQIQTITEE